VYAADFIDHYSVSAPYRDVALLALFPGLGIWVLSKRWAGSATDCRPGLLPAWAQENLTRVDLIQINVDSRDSLEKSLPSVRLMK